VPETQEAESVTILNSLLVAPDRTEKGFVGQRIHRGNMSSSFPSRLMTAAGGAPEGVYVRLLRRESMEKDRLDSHGMKPC
jgi:hypothetical protein